MSPDTFLKIVHHRCDGNFYEICYVDISKDSMPEFIGNLEVIDTCKVLALFDAIIEVEEHMGGIMKNEQKVKYTRDGMYELKPGRVRLPFFFIGRRIIITHGYTKPTKKIQSRNIKRAKDIRKRVEEYNEKQ